MLLRLKFKTIKKLNIGGSYPVKSRADIPVLRTYKNGKLLFYIPGSTIKGVLRTSLIRVAHLIGYRSVSPYVSPELLRESGLEDIVVKIFGGPGDRYSKIVVEPAYIDSDSQIITHISINEKLGVVEAGALYTIEYLPVGVEFSTNVHCYGFDVRMARALLVAISALRLMRIGRGGLVDVKIDLASSSIPDEFKDDPVVRVVLEVLGI